MGDLVPIVNTSGTLAHTSESDLVHAFLSGCSANTRDAYARDLACFAAFQQMPSARDALLQLIALPHGVANGAMLAFRTHMQGEGLTPATINRRLAALRSAVRLARVLGQTTWTPEIDGLRVQSYRDTHGPGLDGTRSMMASACQQEPVKAARDSAIIRMMFDLGLRRGEVVALDICDVDRDARRLWIKSKGKLQKEAVTMPDKTLAALEAWLSVRSSSSAAVFVGLSGPKRGERITGRGVYHVISTIGSDVGIKTRPHGLRHASITAALDANNGDVRAVQQHARHSKPETTIRYDDNRKDLAGKIAAQLADVL